MTCAVTVDGEIVMLCSPAGQSPKMRLVPSSPPSAPNVAAPSPVDVPGPGLPPALVLAHAASTAASTSAATRSKSLTAFLTDRLLAVYGAKLTAVTQKSKSAAAEAELTWKLMCVAVGAPARVMPELSQHFVLKLDHFTVPLAPVIGAQ